MRRPCRFVGGGCEYRTACAFKKSIRISERTRRAESWTGRRFFCRIFALINRSEGHAVNAVLSPVAARPAKAKGVSEAEWRTRCDLAALYRLAALHGWGDLLATHISARVPDE